MALSPLGRTQLNSFMLSMATAASVNVGSEFAIEPAILQTLHDKMVEDGSWFLDAINVAGVAELKGEKIYMDVNGLISSRTDTSGEGERSPRQMHDLTNQFYELFKQDADIAMRYQTIDSWKHFKDFGDRYRKAYRLALANDRVRIGWHGTSAAIDTNPVANPNGEDVNIGWLQRLRNEAAAQIDSVGTTFGAGGEYANLDSLVHSARQMVPSHFRKNTGMVALISDDLISVEQSAYYEANGNKASEKRHLNDGRLLDTFGGLQAIVPPFLPDGTIVVTSLSNLSIYYQEGSWRRTLKDKPEKDQVQDFNSRNEGYVIENEEAIACVEGITVFAG